MKLLAEHLVELADTQAVTPVVIAQPGLRLRPPFYRALAEALLVAAGRGLQYEFIGGLDGWNAGAQRLALRRLANQLNAMSLESVQAVQVAVIGRPAGKQRPLVVGVACGDVPLPPWAQPVHVCTRPTQATDFQLLLA